MSQPYDIAIIGAGIVGLATGLALVKRKPSLRLVILEKEPKVGAHQTGHNSGVIHAGMYYKPGSLKARLCVDGVRQMIEFCEANGVRYELCGKVIVATQPEEIPVVEEYCQRGTANGVRGLRLIGPEELREIEPHAAGLKALHSPYTGIVDYKQVAAAMARQLQEHGARLMTASGVTDISPDGSSHRILMADGEVGARHLINCAGLHADVVARMAGVDPGLRIVPFRGEYSFLRAERQHLVRGLIYPVADPRLPFLGVHFTKTIDGRMEMGPNAVLAFAREGYSRWKTAPSELWDTLTYGGFWRLAGRYWQHGIYEWYRSFSKAALVRSLQKLVPEVRADDVAPGGAGVRAQAISPDGQLVYDFHVVPGRSALHVLNAPSPAATASLAIGQHIAGLAAEAFGLD